MSNKEKYEQEFNSFLCSLSESLPKLYIRGKFQTFCPAQQFFRVDFLYHEDWPHSISDNSVFIEFKIDFETSKIEFHRCGHIYLTPEDQKKSFLAMASLKEINKVYSGRVEKSVWLRPIKYKTREDAVKKLAEFINRLSKVLDWATDGYPYDRLIQNIY